GGDTWPKEYHNTIFMNNINGARLNNDELTRSGSGYIAYHRDDFLVMNDSWSQWLNFKYGPSGSLFAIDWYDQNQCHSPNPEVHDKTLGRIFKIAHKDDKWVQVNLYEATDMDLVNYQLHENEWYVRQARTILQERGPDPEVHRALKKIVTDNPDITSKLRALWTLHVTKGLSEAELRKLLDHSDEYMRSWAIQLLTEDKKVAPETLRKFEAMAETDDSALVRLYLTSGILRLEPEKRWGVLEGLVQRSEDAGDHNLPLMQWYAAEPLAVLDAERALKMAERTKIPDFLPYMIRRVGEINTPTAKRSLEASKERLGQRSNRDDGMYNQKLIDSLLTK
ncbi:hypothetical protein, partial [Pricia sp.]|uniref:DUF7133 domain-containing protein n=1 Tax=Pricia sp. TaxID=2268138 RepID=UPI00359476EA